MIDLVTLAQAKYQLRILSTNTTHDNDIVMKIHQASEIVMNYYKHYTVPDEWIVNSSPMSYAVPPSMQAATLLVLGELFENREANLANILSDGVRSLIPRDPTLA